MLPLKRGVKITLVFIKRNIILITLGILIGGGGFLLRKKVFSFYRTLSPYRFKIGIVGKYTLKTLPPEISRLISLGLTVLDTNGTPLPGAALSWEIEDQGKKYIFHLDPNLTWHDHSPFLAKDIDYQIKGAKIIPQDKHTVIFQLENPFSPLPVFVSQPLFKKGKLGLGEYRIKKMRLRAGYLSELVLRSNQKKEYLLVFRFYPNQNTLINAFKVGEVDYIFGVTDLKEFEGWKNISIVPRQEITKRYVALFFNTQKNPFKEKKFRQALSYAIKKPDKTNRAFTPISPLSWAYNKNVKTYPFNPEHARKIFQEAEIKQPEEIKITLTTNKELVSWAEQIKEDWERFLGIKTEVRVSPFVALEDNFDVLLGYGVILPDPDQYLFWHSDQPGNITRYSNPRIDQLLEKGRQSFVKEERKKIYQDFQRFLLEDVPALFLFFPETYQISRGKKLPINLNL